MSERERITTEAPAPLPAPVTLQEVAAARERVASLKRLIEATEEAIAQTENGRRLNELRQGLSEEAEATRLTESAYRAQCVRAYEETGEKQQPGGAVKTYQVLRYDEGAAVDFAIRHGHSKMLKLDKGAFEKAAKALELDFVEIAEEPRMTLAADLSEWLEAE